MLKTPKVRMQSSAQLSEVPADAAQPKRIVPPVQGRKRGLASVTDPEDVSAINCCSRNCARKFLPSVIKEIRNEFHGQKKVKQALLDYLTSQESLCAAGRYDLTLRGVRVCDRAFQEMSGLARSSFYEVKRQHRAGVRTAEHGNAGRVRDTTMRNAVVSFLQLYIEQAAEVMPHNANRNLPTCTSLPDLFDEFCAINGRQTVVAYRYFASIFNKFFPDVKMPKENRFSRCDVCSLLKEQRLKAARGDFLLHSEIAAFRAQHRQEHMLQRQHFENEINKAKQFPNNQITVMTRPDPGGGLVMTDGMDQRKTQIPYSRFCFSSLSTAQTLQLHVMGVLLFGRSLTFFSDICEYPHDSNLNLTVLLLSMRGLNDLPKSLHLQLDNTCRENKNQYVFAFLALLVETKVFDKVTVGFLMKGHTHAQIDQSFSRLSTHLGTLPRGCLTFAQFTAAVKACYSSRMVSHDIRSSDEGDTIRPDPVRLTKVYAIREWLLPHIVPMCNLFGHHNFELTRGADDGKCAFRFKEWAWSDWKTAQFSILKSHPTTPPLVVKPNYDKVNLDKLASSLSTITAAGVLTPEEKSQWDELIDAEKQRMRCWNSKPSVQIDGIPNSMQSKLQYAMDEDIWVLDELRQQPQGNTANESTCLHPALLRSRDRMEQHAPPVMPVSDRARWRRQQEAAAAKAEDEIGNGTIVLLAPDIPFCIQHRLPPALYPWLARAEGEIADGQISVTWFESSAPGLFEMSGRQDELRVECILAWNLKLLSSKRLSARSCEEVNMEMVKYQAQFEKEMAKQSDDSDEGNSSDSSDDEPLSSVRLNKTSSV